MATEEQLFRQQYGLDPNADISSVVGWQYRTDDLSKASTLLKAKIAQARQTGGKDTYNYLKNLGLVTGDANNGKTRQSDIAAAYARLDADKNLSGQILGKIGLSDENARKAFLGYKIGPASGVTAQMRATDPNAAQAQYQKIDPNAGPNVPGATKNLNQPNTGQVVPQTPPNTPASPIAPVNAPQTPTAQTTPQTGNQPLGATLGITSNLAPGSQGAEVKKLQDFLVSQGFMTAQDLATGPGIYGPKTTAAVAAWQAANKIDTQGNSGYFGPISRSFIQNAKGGGAVDTKLATETSKATPAQPVSDLTPTQQEYASHLQTKTYQDYVDTLSKDSGLDLLKKTISDSNKALLDLRNKKTDEANEINNNPWISESQRVRKIQNLESKYQGEEANLIDSLQLTQKQYDDAQQEIQFIAKMAVDQQNADRAFEMETKKFAESLKTKPTADVQNYEYYKSKGGTKSFEAFMKDKEAGGGGSGGVGGGTNQYSQALGVILGSGKFTKDQVAQITNAINNGEDPMTVIKNQAKNILGQTEATKVTNFEVARDQLNDVNALLSEYYASGGKTNIFSGTFEKTINNLGTVNDPKLVSLATQIASALQIYRNAVSGTAYSVQEGAQIAAIFPGINKSEGLNKAIIDGRQKAFDSTINASYRSALGSSYDTLLNAASGAGTTQTPSTPSGVRVTAPDGSVLQFPDQKSADAFQAVLSSQGAVQTPKTTLSPGSNLPSPFSVLGNLFK